MPGTRSALPLPSWLRRHSLCDSPNGPDGEESVAGAGELDGMENALLVGLSRLVALERQFDVVANNIANLNTTGFKSSSSIFQEFLGSGAQENAFAPNDAGVRFVLDRASLL